MTAEDIIEKVFSRYFTVDKVRLYEEYENEKQYDVYIYGKPYFGVSHNTKYDEWNVTFNFGDDDYKEFQSPDWFNYLDDALADAMAVTKAEVKTAVIIYNKYFK